MNSSIFHFEKASLAKSLICSLNLELSDRQKTREREKKPFYVFAQSFRCKDRLGEKWGKQSISICFFLQFSREHSRDSWSLSLSIFQVLMSKTFARSESESQNPKIANNAKESERRSHEKSLFYRGKMNAKFT